MQPAQDIGEKKLRRKTFIAFGIFAALQAAGVYSWLRIKNLPPDNGLLGGVQPPIRKILDVNGRLFDKTLSPDHLAKTYPVSEALTNPRVNGDIGLEDVVSETGWKLSIAGASGQTRELSLADIQKLPKTDIVFDFKCIEGWSMITHWGGVRFSDFAAAYLSGKETSMQYLGLSTPDNEYYVGIDMPSALHPQTLLCYEMNGRPLLPAHGYPLRLIIPVKYGIKSLKRIGMMYFDNERPPDYWFERGYDYYSGL